MKIVQNCSELILKAKLSPQKFLPAIGCSILHFGTFGLLCIHVVIPGFTISFFITLLLFLLAEHLYLLICMMDPGYVTEEKITNLIDSETKNKVTLIPDDTNKHPEMQENVQLEIHTPDVENNQFSNDINQRDKVDANDISNNSIIDINEIQDDPDKDEFQENHINYVIPGYQENNDLHQKFENNYPHENNQHPIALTSNSESARLNHNQKILQKFQLKFHMHSNQNQIKNSEVLENNKFPLNQNREFHIQFNREYSHDKNSPILEETFYIERRYCTICSLEQPLRSKHCRKCNRCIANYDHHCPWIGTCVGERNRGIFFIYLNIQLIEIIWGFLLLIAKVKEIYVEINKYDQKLKWSYVADIVVGMIFSFFFFFVGSLVFYQAYLISKGLTTWELSSWNKISYLKEFHTNLGSPFDKGFIQNWKNVIFHRFLFRKSLANWNFSDKFKKKSKRKFANQICFQLMQFMVHF